MSENVPVWGAIVAPLKPLTLTERIEAHRPFHSQPTAGCNVCDAIMQDSYAEANLNKPAAFASSDPEAHQQALTDARAENTAKVWAMPETPDLETPVDLPYATEGLTEDQIRALYIWENTKAQLTKLKAFEMEVRKAIVYDGGFFNSDVTSGTEKVELGGGYGLKSVKKETYNLDSDKVEEALTHFTETEANLLVKWEATLSVKAFKQLSEEQQAFFNDCLEIKYGAPTLEITAPKVKA